MIKGLAITPPILGRISIGRIIEKNGKRLPEKDDQFTITSQIQNKDGWVKHPLDEQLRAKAPSDENATSPSAVCFKNRRREFRASLMLIIVLIISKIRELTSGVNLQFSLDRPGLFLILA